jgi:hypothetical protein
MASKGNTKKAAEEFLKTGVAPEIVTDEKQEEGDLEEQLDELAAEQEGEEEAPAEDAEEVEEAPKPDKKDKKTKEEAPAEDAEEEEEAEEADGNVADEDPNALPEEVAALPRVQALLKAEEEINVLKDALAEGYSIDAEKDFPAAIKQLRLERSDAHMLYQIIDQTLPVSSFLTNLEKGFDQKKIVEPIYLNMCDHLGKNGFLEAYVGMRGFKLVPKDQTGNGAAPGTLGQAVDGAAKGNPELQPLVEQIKQLQARLDGKTPGAAGQLTPDERKAEDGFEGEIKRLMAEKSIAEDLFGDFKSAIIQAINQYPGGAAAIKNRIAKGNFVDVRRFFTNHNNAQLERAQKYLKPVNAGSKKVVVKPGAGKGNATPKPNSKKPPVPMTQAQRRAKVLEAFNGKQ